MKTGLKIIIGVLVAAGIAFALRGKTPGQQEIPKEQNEKQPVLSYQEGLPEAVETKRQAIAAAESYEELAMLAGENFSYSFGGPYEGGFAEYLRLEAANTGIDIFKRLRTILSLPYIQHDDMYTWPAVFLKEPKDWTDEDLAVMKKLATEEEIEMYREFGSYVGHRIGIREDGTWLYFIAGD